MACGTYGRSRNGKARVHWVNSNCIFKINTLIIFRMSRASHCMESLIFVCHVQSYMHFTFPFFWHFDKVDLKEIATYKSRSFYLAHLFFFETPFLFYWYTISKAGLPRTWIWCSGTIMCRQTGKTGMAFLRTLFSYALFVSYFGFPKSRHTQVPWDSPVGRVLGLQSQDYYSLFFKA